MNELFDLIGGVPILVKVAGGLMLLLVAYKPTVRYARSRLEKEATKMEINHFQLLRKEIGDLHQMLLSEQRQKQEMREQNNELLETIAKLQIEITDLKLQIQKLTHR